MGRNAVLFLIVFLSVFFSFGCLSEPNNISEPTNVSEPEVTYSKTGSVKAYYPSPNWDFPYFNLATLIQESDIIVEVVVSDMEDKQIISYNYGQVAGIPYEIRDADYTTAVNEILKTNQDIGEVILNIEGNAPDLKVGDRAVLFIETGSYGNSICTPLGILIQDSDIYAGLCHQIGLNDLKEFIQNVSKSDDYAVKYFDALFYDDIIFAQVLTDTNLSQTAYFGYSPIQTHEAEVISSVSGKTGHMEFEHRVWYFTDQLIRENNIDVGIFDDSGWVKTDDGSYRSAQWDPKTSLLKNGEYYLIYLTEEHRFHYENRSILGSGSVKHIEKYDSRTQKEVKELIEEYQEFYKLAAEYESGPWGVFHVSS
ncbi:MAG: hypothetical protein LBU81_04285 [Methanosarcinales archaeon]|jgi:hypothetical protein|nr:hypothetical protein [Methanosarcinales archaeon]